MRTNYVLIDFESVQPEILVELEQEHFRLFVFVGANQTKIPADTVFAIQRMSSKAEYVRISGNGPNALDFHISFYIGQLSAADNNAFFHIISKDKGFDPLIQHLKSKGIYSSRCASISEIPLIKASKKQTPGDRANMFFEKLSTPKATKPRTLKTLSSAINAMFQKQLNEDDVVKVINALKADGRISINEDKIIFKK